MRNPHSELKNSLIFIWKTRVLFFILKTIQFIPARSLWHHHHHHPQNLHSTLPKMSHLAPENWIHPKGRASSGLLVWLLFFLFKTRHFCFHPQQHSHSQQSRAVVHALFLVLFRLLRALAAPLSFLPSLRPDRPASPLDELASGSSAWQWRRRRCRLSCGGKVKTREHNELKDFAKFSFSRLPEKRRIRRFSCDREDLIEVCFATLTSFLELNIRNSPLLSTMIVLSPHPNPCLFPLPQLSHYICTFPSRQEGTRSPLRIPSLVGFLALLE